MKHKWLKRILLVVACLILIGILTTAVAYRQLRGMPEWYAARKMFTPAQLEEAYGRAEKRLADLNNWADQSRGDVNRAAASNPSHLPAPNTQPAAKTYTVELTEDEINAFLQRFLAVSPYTPRVEKYVSGLAISLDDDGTIVLAGNVKELKTVASAHLQAKVDPKTDLLDIQLTKVMGGRLPLPGPLWASQRAKAVDAIASQIPTYRTKADIDPKGTANYEAIMLALFSTLQNILVEKPSKSTILLPVAGKGAVPAHVTGLSVADKTLSLTIEPVSPAQRQAFLDALRTSAAQPSTPTASAAH